MVETDPNVQGQVVKPAHSLEQFVAADWGLLLGTALFWGSSFIWIEEALEAFRPGLISLLRIGLGAAMLVVFPRARAKVERSDLPALALLGLLWMAAPFLLFPIAQQWIDSSLAGMINGAVPIFAALVAAVVARRPPTQKQVLGLAIGFAGVVVISRSAIEGANSTALGVALVLMATCFYGIAINIAAPLQQRYGSLPVILRTQLFALMFTLAPGLFAIRDSSFKATSLLAVIPLGCLGTGIAFVTMATLMGKVGPARASVAIYFVPVVAVALGAIVRNDSIAPIALLGTAMVIAGAYLTSRKQNAPQGIP